MFNQAEHKECILGMLDMIRTQVENAEVVCGSFDVDRPDISPIYESNGEAVGWTGTKHLIITIELDLILGENKG